MASVQDLDSAVIEVALLTKFFAWNVTQSSWKQSIVICCDQATHIFLIHNWQVWFLTIEHTIFSIMAKLTVVVLLCCYSFIVLCNGVNRKHTSLWITH